MLFDTHAHLDDKRFDEDREALLSRLPELGISLCINAGADMESSRNSIELAERYETIYAAVGVHPHDASSLQEKDIKQLALWTAHPKVKAIGEIGLDYHYDFSPRELQKKWFIRQLELAYELGMPVIVHDREAHGDLLDILRERKRKLPPGVLHCFSGSWEMAQECLDFGWYISFAGPLTFKNAGKLPDIAAKLPEDRILIETDSPYLTPVPYRGERNDPGRVRLVAERLADIRGCSFEEICHVTLENGKRLFGIK